MGVVFGKISEELPRYTTVFTASDASYTVRRYQPAVAACANYTASWGTSGDGSPFGALARFIGVFGTPENMQPERQKSEPIAMTAPVLIDNSQTMMFLVPASKYSSVAEVPKPTNSNVRLEMLPERLQAVRAFSGNLKHSRAEEQLRLLLADLKRDGWQPKKKPTGDEVDWQAAGYNAPFVLPWFKTNEVLVSVMEREQRAD
jgi:hypothetical protein